MGRRLFRFFLMLVQVSIAKLHFNVYKQTKQTKISRFHKYLNLCVDSSYINCVRYTVTVKIRSKVVKVST